MPATDTREIHWSRIREAGTLWGLQFLRMVHDRFGRGPVSFFLHPVALYFVVFRPAARNSSMRYLKLHERQYPAQWQTPPRLRASIKHFYTFAESVVDKLMSWCVPIEPDRFVINSLNMVEQLMHDTRGQLIIGSHFGNLEFCRGFMQRYKNKVINVLAHDKHSVNYNTLMGQLNPDSRLNIFQVEDFDLATILTLKQKIDAGEWVFIAGDRTPLSGNTNTVPVHFLGETARFPIGPYLLAKSLGCPVKLMFSHCDYFAPDKPVHFDLIDFADKITLGRDNRAATLTSLAQRFAVELEKQCAKAPFHWFNFYDFWKPGDSVTQQQIADIKAGE